MQITVKAAIGAQVTSAPIDVEPGLMIKSVIVEFCHKIDIPITGDIQMKNDNGQILFKDGSIAEAGIHNGDTVYISQSQPRTEEDSEHRVVRVRRNMDRQGTVNIILVVVGFVFVTGSICGIIALAVRFIDEICVDEGYGAVFDAGSSHTNLTIYSWPGDSKIGGTGAVTQQGTCRSAGGGISSYEDNPQDAGPSLTSCLDNIKDVVPKQYYDYTSLHLGATAGMRLLEKTQPATSAAIMKSVRASMASYPFNFSSDQAIIISGFEEGTYGWVSANFLSGTLNPSSTLWNAVAATFSSDLPSTYGALDLGGASTQITFLPEDPSSLPTEYTAHLRLYGRDFKLYTHSYLCYGINEAIRRFKANLVKDAQYATSITNPCAPKGFSEAVDSEYLWKAPCSNGPQALAGWGSEVARPPNAENSTTFNLTGTGDSDGCRTAVGKLFDFYATCDIKPCSFNGVYQPKPYGNFLAFSTFEKLISGLGLAGNASINDILNMVQSFCAKTYEEIKKMPGNIQFLVLYCFEINYVSTLLLQGYGFNDNTWKMKFTGEVKGQELGWSLGFMINATNMIPTEASCTQFSTAGFYVGIAILVTSFTVGFVVLVVAIYRCTRRNTKGTYEELNTNNYGSV